MVQTRVEELPENRVRLEVVVPSAEVKHAVDHAASDLAQSLRIPGFRKGKVPMQVLLARVGRERLFAEAVESHIGGWFWNAAGSSGLRPIESPQYGYEPPDSTKEDFRFTATVGVQPKPELPAWRELEVPAGEPAVPPELIERELEALRDSVAELVPVGDRPAQEGDTVVVDLISAAGDAQRDYVAELGAGRLLEAVERGLLGMSVGQTDEIEYELPDGSTQKLNATIKDVKEKVLPPLDDELAQAASEFDSLDELRADVESKLGEQIQAEIESAFRAATADALVEASRAEPAAALVEARAAELWKGMSRSLERRGIPVETYLEITGDTPERLRERLIAEARQSIARELVLEAVADELGIEISDGEVEALIREQAEAAEEDADATIAGVREAGGFERLREDVRLRAALDRVAAEVKRIPVELARAREKLWTPEQEKTPGDTKLWTPASKEPA